MNYLKKNGWINKWLVFCATGSMVVLVFLFSACGGAHQQEEIINEVPFPAMEMDRNPVLNESDKQTAASKKPLPLPTEPYVTAEPGKPLPASMLLDSEQAAPVLTPEPENNKPQKMPEEPGEPQKGLL